VFLIGHGDMGSKVAEDLIRTQVLLPPQLLTAISSKLNYSQSFVPGRFTVCVRLVERRQHLLQVRPASRPYLHIPVEHYMTRIRRLPDCVLQMI
jgi:hypothetical protein